MLNIDHASSARVPAPPSRCMELLADVEDYPRWASLIGSASVLGPGRVRLRAELLGLGFEMDCTLELGDGRAVLRRVPYDALDPERYEATWIVEPHGGGSEVRLHVVAAIEAPGPAAIIRRPVSKRLVDDLLSDFAEEF
jgi:hypothetical protein